jgi:hypothetical protein
LWDYFCIFGINFFTLVIMAYTDKQKESIFNHIFKEITNGRALRTILKVDEGMPDVTTFYAWLDESEEKSKQYVRACDARADKIFEEILEIADDSSRDVLLNKDGDEYLNTEFVQRSRLRVDARKWAASKLAPKKYGDRIQHANDPDNPITTITREIVKPKD